MNQLATHLGQRSVNLNYLDTETRTDCCTWISEVVDDNYRQEIKLSENRYSPKQ